MKRTNYEKLSATYNRRYKQNKMLATLSFLRKDILNNKARIILEIGSGTGYWLKNLNVDGTKLFGLDYSMKMLSVAKQETTNVNLVRGAAEHLPFAKNSIDYIFVVNAIHHFGQKEKFLAEAIKLLKTGGKITIVLADIFHPGYKWYIYDYFERAFEIDAQRLPRILQLKEWLENKGCNEIEEKEIEVIKDERRGKEVLDDHFLTRTGNSTLFALTEEEYAAGLSRIEKTAENPNVAFETNVIFKAVSCRKGN